MRIGLLVDSLHIPKWQSVVVEEIGNLDDTQITHVVRKQGRLRPPRWQRIISERHKIAHVVHRTIDRKLFPPTHDPFTPVSLIDVLPAPTIIDVTPRETRFSDYVEGDDLAAIKQANLDILIRFGFRIIRGELLSVPRYGVWSYHHGDNRANRGGPPGYWEMALGWDKTGSTLQVLTENLDDGLVLDRTAAATISHSYAKNVENIYWAAIAMLPRAIQRLNVMGAEAFFADVKTKQPRLAAYSHTLFKTPRNGDVVKHTLKQAGRITQKVSRRLTHKPQWILMFALGDTPITEGRKFTPLVPPADRFWADPHVVATDDGYLVFIEEFLYEENKGWIAVLPIDKKGNVGESSKVLELPYHMSFPFVFSRGSTHYLIPDTSEDKHVSVYAAVDFPHAWQHHVTLLSNLDAADSVLHSQSDCHWLFTATKPHAGSPRTNRLSLYYNDGDLFSGVWHEHLQSPVMKDVENARPGGAVFNHGGKSYLPLQNNTKNYGYGVNINEIVSLTKTDVRLNPVARLVPEWSPQLIGVHSFAYTPGITVIDACKMKPRLSF